MNTRSTVRRRTTLPEVTVVPVTESGDNSEPMSFIGPQNMSMSERRANGFAAPYVRKRKSYSRKKKTTTRRRPRAGGFPVYHPTGDVAGVIGRGGYFTDALGNMARAARRMVPEGAFSRLGSAGGAALGGAYGNPGLGAQLGGLAGSSIAKLVGFGAYHVQANSLLAKIDEGVQIPAFGDMTNATIVTHRSYVQDIITPATPTAFTVQQLRINAANAQLFPWLATVANSYEQYQIVGMIFQYKSLSSDSSTSLPMGSITMATKYEANDGPFASKIAMENSQYCVSGRPSDDMVHILECDPSVMSDPIKWNLQSDVYPLGRDPRMYDVGTFQIATSGLPSLAGQVLGELWVSYEVALYRPILNTMSATDKFSLGSTPVSPSTMLASTSVALTPDAGSTMGGTALGSIYRFPSSVVQGTFLVTLEYLGTSTTLTTNLFPTFVGCSADANSAARVQSGAVSFYQQGKWVVSVTAANASINFGAGSPTLPTAMSRSFLTVTRIPDVFATSL